MVCLCVHFPITYVQLLCGQKGTSDLLELEFIDNCELSWRCWKSNQGPLHEQPVHSTAESSTQLRFRVLFFVFFGILFFFLVIIVNNEKGRPSDSPWNFSFSLNLYLSSVLGPGHSPDTTLVTSEVTSAAGTPSFCSLSLNWIIMVTEQSLPLFCVMSFSLHEIPKAPGPPCICWTTSCFESQCAHAGWLH